MESLNIVHRGKAIKNAHTMNSWQLSNDEGITVCCLAVAPHMARQLRRGSGSRVAWFGACEAAFRQSRHTGERGDMGRLILGADVQLVP